MNINTPEGMAEAVAWQENIVKSLVQGGRWVVPRSGTIYAIDHAGKRAMVLLAMRPEPTIERVFRAMGWTVVPNPDLKTGATP